jgi:uroporphyrinogen decarboxylase
MTIPLSSHRLIRAFLRQPVDMTPIWLMRQAGRYLPEYRKLREKAGDFLTLCKTPELACEITLQPLQRFDLDGAIIFSDILTIPDAMGLGLEFVHQEGPQFRMPVRQREDIEKLPIPDPEIELSYVMDTIRLVKSSLKNRLPVLGFSGSPWTLAAYMIEGRGKTEFPYARKMLYQNPGDLHLLLEKLAASITLYLNAQIKAGVDAVMIFDTWGGLLSTEKYAAFSLAYIKKIIANLNCCASARQIPVILFTKQGGQWLELMLTSGCHVLGIDWTCELSAAKKRVGHAAALQGNLDPLVLSSSPSIIEKEVEKILSDFGPHPGHIFNLGHGVPQDTPFENIDILVNTVHRLSKVYHSHAPD